ncbi:MAG: polysaccharide lyase 6 family protein [Prosthecobacter sp.]|uniref:polysaccharide lyase 6 family protein n=1 Tax=Prosthecobacter sp. TaxID=1965333 RepID=UPI00260D07D8|nr:polysaccharide lyase 6 family protein [Prosthecobacter sp.]MCF7789533.1 polysaccharide lyase 6 family protein [Prosthecobacter sp.]
MRLTLFALALAIPALARDIPVADAAAFAAAAQTINAGDTLILNDGTWADAQLKLEAEGTAANPVTIKAQTPGKVIFTGTSRLSVGGSHITVVGLWFQNPTAEQVIELRKDSKQLASDSRITNCAVTNDTQLTSTASAQFVSIYGARNRVDHCYIAGKTTQGTTMVVWLSNESKDQGKHQIDHNHFGPRQKLGQNGGETIRLGDSKTSMQTAACIVEHNLFEKCDGEAECISNKSCGNVYRFNTFKGVSGTLTLRHGNKCIVSDNVFDGTGAKGAGGVRVIGEYHIVEGNHFENLTGDNERSALCIMLGIPDSPANGYFQVKHAEITQNSFVSCAHNILIGMSGDKKATLPPVETRISDNYIDTSKGEAFEIKCAVDGVTTKNNSDKKSGQPDKFQYEPTGPSWK